MEIRKLSENTNPSDAGAWNSTGTAVKVYKCHKFDCDFETTELLPKCPVCGFSLLDPTAVRTLGVAMAVLGGILALGGAALLIFATPKLQKDGAVKYAIIGVFVALFAAGAVATVAGVKQAATASKSGNLIAAMAALFVVLAVVVAVLRVLF
ncbi:MAG: hypothetical protein ABIP78_13370 [Pyrinomonadaceae bacterium]